MRIALIVVVLLCASEVAVAQTPPQCTLYRVNFQPYAPWATTAGQACEATLPTFLSSQGGAARFRNMTSEVSGAAPGQCRFVGQKDYAYPNGSWGPFDSSYFPIATQVGDCPPPPVCDSNTPGVGDQMTSTVNPGANGYCHAISHCKMEVTASMSAGGGTLYTVTHTDQECAHGGVPPPGPGDVEDGEKCITTSAGNEICLAKDGKNCGYLNDNFVCLPQIDDDGCEVFGDSSRVCGPDAPTPPVPDSGTPGDPAEPDEEITDETGDTYNYYNTTTVSGSARPPGTSGDNPYDGDDGDGSGPIEGDDGDGEGEGECPEGATCDGALPDAGEFEEVCTFGECAEAFFARVQGAPLVAGVLGVGAGFPAGSCPNWTLEAFGADYLLSAPMCSIWEDVSPVLSAVFLVIWAWVATRIVLSA